MIANATQSFVSSAEQLLILQKEGEEDNGGVGNFCNLVSHLAESHLEMISGFRYSS